MCQHFKSSLFRRECQYAQGQDDGSLHSETPAVPFSRFQILWFPSHNWHLIGTRAPFGLQQTG